MKLYNIKILYRLLGVVACGAIGLIVFGLFASNMSYDLIVEERKAKAKTQIETVGSLVQDYVDRADEFGGTEKAQEMALKAVNALRYDGNQYFWINDLDGIMIMHPLNKKLIGKDIRGYTDPYGKLIFTDLIDIVKQKGSGYYSYWWQTKNDPEPREKISYVWGQKDWGWVIGTGNYIDDVVDTFSKFANILIAIGAGVLVVTAIIAVLITRTVTRPLAELKSVMDAMIAGRYDVTLSNPERKDEIGEIGRAVETFRANEQEKMRIEDERKKSEQEQIEQMRRTELHKLADSFDASVGSIVSTVATASSQLTSTAQSMSDVSLETSNQATSASSASEQTSSNVQMVASATEEMTSTIGEISQQVSNASNAIRDAVDKVQNTSSQMDALAETATKIGEVVEMISNIAEQTNLLALNATIESARAGEAGKGFAVVAGEVKELAGQTAKATDEIAQQINDIQQASKQASNSMTDVNAVIAQVDEIATGIAAAMEEQNAATNEIAGSIDQAAQGTQLVNENVVAVARASEETGAASQQVMHAASELSTQSSQLRDEVNRFIAQVRAG